MININVNIVKDKDENNRKPANCLCATDFLDNIKENKIVINGIEKNIISSTKLLSKLRSLGYIEKLSKSKGYISKEKYKKKKYFKEIPYNVKDNNGNTIKTTYTVYFTRKGQKKLYHVVLELIKEKIKE